MRWVESLIAAAAMTLFCVVLFSYVLKLPFPLWPSFILRGRAMFDLFQNLALGFSIAAQPANIGFCLLGCPGRHADRRAAGHRPGGDDRDAAADHLRAGAGRRR